MYPIFTTPCKFPPTVLKFMTSLPLGVINNIEHQINTAEVSQLQTCIGRMTDRYIRLGRVSFGFSSRGGGECNDCRVKRSKDCNNTFSSAKNSNIIVFINLLKLGQSIELDPSCMAFVLCTGGRVQQRSCLVYRARPFLAFVLCAGGRVQQRSCLVYRARPVLAFVLCAGGRVQQRSCLECN